ncbi:hypothetical protein KQH89_16405, partial [Vibrio cholerae]|nr:hypothetical protein [Vibrio cholerae]
SRVRIAIPDYIGVREPQYTTAVGLIKFSYKNSKLQGGNIHKPVTVPAETREKVQRTASQKPAYEKKQVEK